MAFTINLASENVAVLKRARLGLIAASVGLFLTLAAAVMDGAAQRQQYEREQARTAELSEHYRTIEERLRQEGLVLTGENRAALQAQVQVANRMLDERSFLWSALLRDLEQAVPWGVSLMAIQFQPSDATVTLRGEALTESQLTGSNGLLRTLEEADAFHDVAIADQKTQPNGVVEFMLHVRYRQTIPAG